MLGDFVIDGYPHTSVDVKGFADRGERDISEHAYEVLRRIKTKYPDGRLAVVNCFAEYHYDNQVYNNGDIIVADGIYDGHSPRIDRIIHLMNWVKN